jgi:hypothetical protein
MGHVAAGANVDGQIVRHFGTDALWSRDQILRNLRTVLAHLDFDRHEHLCRPRNSDFCQLPEAARAEICGTRMTLCLSELAGEDRPLVVGGWATVLHEVVHLACIGDLPEFRLASPEQRRRGEFETYYHEQGTSSEDPRFSRYPSAHSLRNADSYAAFVRAVGDPSWTPEPEPLGVYFPNLTLGIGTALEALRPSLIARLTWTPYGEALQFIGGLSALWTPNLGLLDPSLAPALVPRPDELSTYVGAEGGLRLIAGGSEAAFVFETAGAAGVYVRQDLTIDPALAARLSVGLRYGRPDAGISINAELQRVFNLVRADPRLEQDWFFGLNVTGHWGGTSRTPR